MRGRLTGLPPPAGGGASPAGTRVASTAFLFCNRNAGRDASRGRTWPTAVCRKSMHRIAARASHRAPAKPCLFEEQGAGLGVCRRFRLVAQTENTIR